MFYPNTPYISRQNGSFFGLEGGQSKESDHSHRTSTSGFDRIISSRNHVRLIPVCVFSTGESRRPTVDIAGPTSWDKQVQVPGAPAGGYQRLGRTGARSGAGMFFLVSGMHFLVLCEQYFEQHFEQYFTFFYMTPRCSVRWRLALRVR